MTAHRLAAVCCRVARGAAPAGGGAGGSSEVNTAQSTSNTYSRVLS